MQSLEENIIKTYIPGKTSLRDIAKLHNTNHHMVKRILDRNNINIIRAVKRSSETQKNINIKLSYEKIIQSISPIDISNRDIRLFKCMCCKNDKISLEFCLTHFKDYNKIHLLFKLTQQSGKSRNFNWSSIELQNYYLRYYNDELFNNLYNQYLDNDKNTWYKPSLDHIIPISKGGDNHLDNLEMMTWFENKSKGNKSKNKWLKIKTLILHFNLFNKEHIIFPENINENLDRNVNKNSKNIQSRKYLIKNMTNGINKSRKNGVDTIKYNISTEWFNNFDNLNKIKCLNLMRKRIPFTELQYKQYINTFYNDTYFHKLYILWSNGYDCAKPSLDHIIPISKGGNNCLDNLQIISWIENYMKSNIDNKIWEHNYKKNLNTLLKIE